MSERSLARDINAVHRALNRKISVSTVTMYQYCPVAAYLRYVEHHIPQPILKRVLGRVSHAAATAFFEAEKQLISSVDKHSTKETIAQQGINIIRKAAIQAAKTQKVATLDYARKTRSSLLSKVELDRTSIAKQEIALLHYFTNRWAERIKRYSTLFGLTGADLADYLVPCQRRTEVYLENPILGISSARVDVLEDTTPLEIKTGRPPITGAWPNDVIQVTLYAMILEQKVETIMNSAKVSYIVFDETRTIILTRNLRIKALQLTEYIRTMIDRTQSYDRGTGVAEIPSRSHSNPAKCAACSIRHVCPTPVII